jgi:hypothetical protein
VGEPVICVGGTFDPKPAWICDPAHPMQVEMRAAGLEVARHPVTGEPFSWPASLGGIPFLNRGVWPQWGAELAVFALNFPRIRFLCHSHGGAVGAHAAALLAGMRRVEVMYTVGTPVRNDVPNREAAANCDCWLHFYDSKRDWWGTLKGLGKLFDGNVSLRRDYRLPGINDQPLPGIGHSGLLNEHAELWRRYGFFDPILYPREK